MQNKLFELAIPLLFIDSGLASLIAINLCNLLQN